MRQLHRIKSCQKQSLALGFFARVRGNRAARARLNRACRGMPGKLAMANRARRGRTTKKKSLPEQLARLNNIEVDSGLFSRIYPLLLVRFPDHLPCNRNQYHRIRHMQKFRNQSIDIGNVHKYCNVFLRLNPMLGNWCSFRVGFSFSLLSISL